MMIFDWINRRVLPDNSGGGNSGFINGFSPALANASLNNCGSCQVGKKEDEVGRSKRSKSPCTKPVGTAGGRSRRRGGGGSSQRLNSSTSSKSRSRSPQRPTRRSSRRRGSSSRQRSRSPHKMTTKPPSRSNSTKSCSPRPTPFNDYRHNCGPIVDEDKHDKCVQPVKKESSAQTSGKDCCSEEKKESKAVDKKTCPATRKRGSSPGAPSRSGRPSRRGRSNHASLKRNQDKSRSRCSSRSRGGRSGGRVGRTSRGRSGGTRRGRPNRSGSRLTSSSRSNRSGSGLTSSSRPSRGHGRSAGSSPSHGRSTGSRRGRGCLSSGGGLTSSGSRRGHGRSAVPSHGRPTRSRRGRSGQPPCTSCTTPRSKPRQNSTKTCRLPSRPPGPFILYFMKVYRERSKTESNLQVTQVAKEAGRCWYQMSQRQKDLFREQYCVEKERLERSRSRR